MHTPNSSPIFFLCALIASLSLFACERHRNANKVKLASLKPPAHTAKLHALGKKIYNQFCVSCHGTSGKGDGAAARAFFVRPTNFAKGKFRHGGSLKEIFRIITEGSPRVPLMVPWRHLPEQQRWALSYYVKAFSSPKTAHSKNLPKPTSHPTTKPK